MGVVERLFGPRERAGTVSPQDTLWLREAFFGAGSQAGKTVTVETAPGLPAVWAALRVLSDGVGALPFMTYQRLRGGGKQSAWSEPVYKLLHNSPNPEMTAVDCWSLVTVHLNSWGNAYLGKSMAGGRVEALWPIRPDLVRVGREAGEKVFYVKGSETAADERRYTAREIIHIKGMTLDGLVGLSPIQMARESIGHGLALDEYGNRFFSNSAIPRVALRHPETLGEEAANRLSKSWKSKLGGSRKSNETIVLEEGMDIRVLSIPMEDAQFVEQQQFTVQQSARIFNVPASKLGGKTGDSLTYATVEGNSIDFVTYSLRPWLVRIEQALNRDQDLFPASGPPLFCEFSVDGLLRADARTRALVYGQALDPAKGWMTRSEVRELENLPPE